MKKPSERVCEIAAEGRSGGWNGSMVVPAGGVWPAIGAILAYLDEQMEDRAGKQREEAPPTPEVEAAEFLLEEYQIVRYLLNRHGHAAAKMRLDQIVEKLRAR